VSNKHWKLEWQLKNILEWSNIDPGTHAVLEAIAKVLIDYLKNN
jgi:hypothetical protein